MVCNLRGDHTFSSGFGASYVKTYPGVTFIMEWENAKLSEADRAEAMLRCVSGQIADLDGSFDGRPEILILHDPEAIATDTLRQFVTSGWNADAEVDLRIEAARGLEYYEQKNLGATLATRPWLCFIDSDVIPEDGWLETLLEARRTSNAVIVGGQTYVEPLTLTDRAFALFWFFPPRSSATEPYESDRFFANNFMIERETFLRSPFPDSELVRGRCYVLADQYRRAGERIEICPAARVSHPPPNGISHFLKRAVIDGHDSWVMDRTLMTDRDKRPSLFPLRAAKWNVSNAFASINEGAEHMELGFAGRLFAKALATVYYGLAMLGQIMSPLAPSFVRRAFNV